LGVFLSSLRVQLSDIEQIGYELFVLYVPEGPWHKDFGSFKLLRRRQYPKTFLLAGQPAVGRKLSRSPERVPNGQRLLDDLPVLHILRVQGRASRF
jgi:hypothetical protein